MGLSSTLRAFGLVAIFAAAAMAAPSPARAATSGVSPSGFVVTLQQEVKADPHRVYEALGEVDKWWNPRHSYSGNAANLNLPLQIPGCFCERWDGNVVEHARVIYAARDHTLRLLGALGPLQSLAVTGVLTFALTEKGGATMLEATYRVSGNDAAGLQELAGPVDGVLTDMLQRLATYVVTGKPQ